MIWQDRNMSECFKVFQKCFIWNYMCIRSLINWSKTPHVSDRSSVDLQEFFTVHTAIAMLYRFAGSIRTFRPDTARKLSENIYHCCVYSEKTPDDGHRNCPKHVEFYSKNKFEKLVHLVGFILRIYHDARSPEPQT